MGCPYSCRRSCCRTVCWTVCCSGSIGCGEGRHAGISAAGSTCCCAERAASVPSFVLVPCLCSGLCCCCCCCCCEGSSWTFMSTLLSAGRAVWQASLAGSPPAPPPLPWALALGKWAARKGRLSWGLKLAAACAGCRRLVGGWVWKPVAECDEAPLAACCGKFLGCTAAWDKLLGLGIEMCDAGKPCPGRDWPSG